jgi:hypothetical protein
MLLFIARFFTLCFICFDTDGNEIVTNKQLKDDSLVNCRSKHKFIDEDKNVEEPKEGMLFGSIEELLEHYRNYAKQEGFGMVQKKKKKYENRDLHYNKPKGSYLPPHSRSLFLCHPNNNMNFKIIIEL